MLEKKQGGLTTGLRSRGMEQHAVEGDEPNIYASAL